MKELPTTRNLDTQWVLSYPGKMPSFLIQAPAEPGQVVRLADEEAHHLRDVRRIKAGDNVRLADRHGGQYSGKAQSVNQREVFVIINEKTSSVLNQKTRLGLGQALLKGDKMEIVLQKAVELGVHSFHPFSSSRTIAQVKKDGKITRWQRIADEAAKQSGGTPMTVETPVSFEEILKQGRDGLKIIFWENQGQAARGFFSSKDFESSSNKIFTLVGPEGGFSEQEVKRANEAGFATVSLGPRILRAETAAIAAITLIQYELENL